MNVYYITLDRVSTGERALSMMVRMAGEDEPRSYAQDAIEHSPERDDLRVTAVAARL